MFGLAERFEKLQSGGANPYVDPEGYKGYVAGRRNDFLQEFARQMMP
jgi:metallo-beta-lactamase class B